MQTIVLAAPQLCRPQSRTALVGRELDRYKVKIVALSETRLAKEGLLKEVGADYTFFWSGRKKEEWHEAGVVSPSNIILSANSQDFQKA